MDGKPALKGAGLRHVTRYEFWGPIHISGMAEAIELSNFVHREIILQVFQRDDKSPPKGAWLRSRDPFLHAHVDLENLATACR